jgi:hypothetical protein
MMTIANFKIGRRSYVVVPERDFDRIQQDSKKYQRLLEEDRALGELAEKELRAFRKSGGKGVPWEKVKQELGL